MGKKRRTTRKNTMFWNNVQGKEELISCTRKIKRSKAQAKSYAKKHGLYYYKCKFCGKYHVTKIPPGSTEHDIWDIIAPLIELIRRS